MSLNKSKHNIRARLARCDRKDIKRNQELLELLAVGHILKSIPRYVVQVDDKHRNTRYFVSAKDAIKYGKLDAQYFLADICEVRLTLITHNEMLGRAYFEVKSCR